MSNDLLDDLYRELILDHYKQPRNNVTLPAANCAADGSNPLCGDQIQITLTLTDEKVEQIGFTGSGCAISQASASMMTEFGQGRSVIDALDGIAAFQTMMTTSAPTNAVGFDDIDALIGVSKFPARVKCASLGWKTLEQALSTNDGVEVTTE